MPPNYHIIDLRHPAGLQLAQRMVGTLLLPLYRAAFNRRRARFLSRRRPMDGAPVIAVGNLALGGRGKTPIVLALLEAAAKAGRRGAVVLKLGRDPLWFLDELLLYAVRLTQMRTDGSPRVTEAADWVAVQFPSGVLCAHRDKLAGARMMAARRDVDFVLVDDAHQLFSLEPALSVCLLHARDFGEPLFPRGRLREELAAAGRADVVLVQESGGEAAPAICCGSFRLRPQGVLPAEELMQPWVDLDSAGQPAQALPPRGRAVAFAGIGQPEGFEHSLAELGVELAAVFRFPDHHAFSTQNLRALMRQLERTDAGYFVSTEKDCCRLLPLILRARYAEGYQVWWPAGLLPRPTAYLPDLIVAAEEVWRRTYFVCVKAELPAETVARFLSAIAD